MGIKPDKARDLISVNPINVIKKASKYIYKSIGNPIRGQLIKQMNQKLTITKKNKIY